MAEEAASAAEQAGDKPAQDTHAEPPTEVAQVEDRSEPEAHGETRTESERSILPQFIRPLTEAQKQAAVQARLSALKYAEAKNVSDTHGGDHATPAPAHAERAPAPAKAEHHDPEPAPVRKAESHPAPVRAAAPTPKPAPKPKVVLARAAPSDTHAARATKVSSKRAPAKPAEPDLSHIHWDYSGIGGPDNWGKLKPEFSTCENGNRQSPIDISDGIRVDLAPIEFSYLPSYFRIVDNGHTVQVNLGTGSTIRVMGRTYDLIQFHFHRPSEFRIGGRGYDMEVHLVHQDLDGRLAVVSVMLERGTAHPIVQTLWNNLPLERQASYAPEIAIDPNDLLPVDRRYATFMGSLTTPPCTEGVMWMVMRQPVQVSVDQIAIFSRLHPMNARPLQDMADRLIKMSR
ncbi:MAG: carbonic anhydrase family protein [Rhodocyclaceae bacterium]|nr:carbonic anhydrase family protein [Rhodocyclaceae bacterium]